MLADAVIRLASRSISTSPAKDSPSPQEDAPMEPTPTEIRAILRAAGVTTEGVADDRLRDLAEDLSRLKRHRTG